MKKLFVFLMLVVYIAALPLAVYGAETATTTYGTAVIDGKNTDGEWDDVPKLALNKAKLSTGVKSDSFDAYFKTKYDGTSLYVFIEIKDNTISKRPGGVISQENQDRIQTYIDYSNKGSGDYKDPNLKQYQFAVNRNGDYGYYDCIDFNLDDNFEVKVLSDDNGYTIEYMLDLKGITGEEVTGNKEIGFDIQVNDNDTNSETRLCAYGWNDILDQAWQDVSALGKLTLLVESQEEPNKTETPKSTEPDETEEPSNTSDVNTTPKATVTSGNTSENLHNGSEFNTGIILVIVILIAVIAIAVFFIKKKK